MLKLEYFRLVYDDSKSRFILQKFDEALISNEFAYARELSGIFLHDHVGIVKIYDTNNELIIEYENCKEFIMYELEDCKQVGT